MFVAQLRVVNKVLRLLCKLRWYAHYLRIYCLWSPFYDVLFGRLFDQPRRRTIELLDLRPGDRPLIPSIGTGLDLHRVPVGISVVGADVSTEMLDKARSKTEGDVMMLKMDAQTLGFADGSFDAVLLILILGVVPNGSDSSSPSIWSMWAWHN